MTARERRQLEHRAEGYTRMVPTHPELTGLLREHLASFDPAADGRLFAGSGAATCPPLPTAAPGPRPAR
jgi:hypothetical protein